MLELELKRLGMRCWYDNRATDVTKSGMREGIGQSGTFLLFLSSGCLSREFVRYELRAALELEKNIILVHESDPRHSPFDFAKDRAPLPSDLQSVLDDFESIAFRRRDWVSELQYQSACPKKFS